MSMFCYQCQETVGGKGCMVRGVCGKTEATAKLQDLLIYSVKGISEIVMKGKLDVNELGDINDEVINSLFITITNANFDDAAIIAQIQKVLGMRDALKEKVSIGGLHDAATFTVDSTESMLTKASSIGVLTTDNEDIRSLREMIIYGVKGMAAYTEHARNLGKVNLEFGYAYAENR